MQEKIKEISSRIHELRELSDISEEEVANYLNIPVETYHQYDTGEADIPASVLFEIAQFLKFILLAPIAVTACFVIAWLTKQIPLINKIL